MAILVVTNRNIRDSNATDVTLFGEGVNAKGPSELRLAWAEFKNGRWQLELIDEPDDITADTAPSLQVFLACINDLQHTGRNCALYVHGFNKSFEETLDQAGLIHDVYQVATVVFSWPSNPGGIITNEYARARSIAANSVVAFDRLLGLLVKYLSNHSPDECTTSFNLLAHSLGNYLFEKFVRDPIFGGQTRMFDNVFLHQADVDKRAHSQWVKSLRFARRIYVTVNERDSILNLADVIQPDRLGNTVRGSRLNRPHYVDFTGADNIGKKHQLFGSGAKENDNVKAFFQRGLNGEKAHEGQGIVFNEVTGFFDVA